MNIIFTIFNYLCLKYAKNGRNSILYLRILYLLFLMIFAGQLVNFEAKAMKLEESKSDTSNFTSKNDAQQNGLPKTKKSKNFNQVKKNNELGVDSNPNLTNEAKMLMEQNPNQVEFTSQQAPSLTLQDIDKLIEEAKAGSAESQHQLINCYCRILYKTYLTPEKIGFLEWLSRGMVRTIPPSSEPDLPN